MTEQPKRLLSWMALNQMETRLKWKIKVAKHNGEDTMILEERVNAIRDAKDKA